MQMNASVAATPLDEAARATSGALITPDGPALFQGANFHLASSGAADNA
jgi:hypothetical protein